MPLTIIKNDMQENHLSIEAEWKSSIIDAMGSRDVRLDGIGKDKAEALDNAIKQAKTVRDELNLAIEQMTVEFLRKTPPRS